MCSLFTLREMFPQLPWVKRAERWLVLVKNKTIEQQLAERKIAEIRIWDHLVNEWAYLTDNGAGRFRVVLDRNRPTEYFMSLGHEIAHTFHLKPSLAPLFWREWQKDENMYSLIEYFCEEFAIRWTHDNGIEKFRAFFQRNKNTNLISASYE